MFSLIEARELLFGIVPFLESSDDNGDNDDKCIDCSKDESLAVDGFFSSISNGALKTDSSG